MAVDVAADLQAYCRETARRAHRASLEMASLSGAVKNRWLELSAQLLRDRATELFAANERDLAAAGDAGLTPAALDRLRLSATTLDSLCRSLEEIRLLPDPVGEVIESRVRPNGLDVQKVRCPLGVVFFIYESRPNVTVDAASICVKSGNAVILRGGKEALHTNRALAEALAIAGSEAGLPTGAVQLVDTTQREAVGYFLGLNEYITLAIPRGGAGLIRRVTTEARMPVMKHFDGNCHVYVDRSADLDMALQVLVNSKCQRYGVCNAAESLLVHADVAPAFLPRAAQALSQEGVEIRGDERVCRWIPSARQASEADYAAEFLGPIISAAVVDTLEAAIAHINRYGSKHTDAILTRELDAARTFSAQVDTAAVMINASTRFNDGGELGLGAEIGISTDKFHARGPCGLKELTTYKYVVYGKGQLRG